MKKANTNDVQMIANNREFGSWFDRFKLLAVSRFTWEGLDEIGGSSRFMELTLFNYGKGVAVVDDILGFLNLQVTPSDTLNYYYLPTKVIAWSVTYNKEYNFEDVVYVMNNELENDDLFITREYAQKLYELEMSRSINIKAQKTPVLLQGTDKQRLTLENLYAKYDGNTPFIFGDKDYELKGAINHIKTEAPFNADKMQIQKHEIINEYLTYLGINNANQDKKERMITDEVSANDELISYSLNAFYKTRLKAAKEINDKFFDGEEKVKVVINKDIFKMVDEMLPKDYFKSNLDSYNGRKINEEGEVYE